MALLDRVHRAVDRIAGWPLVRGCLTRRYNRLFAANRDANLFRGVFDTYAAAQESAPATRPIGYDNAAAASMYLERTRKVYPTDYPVMFWLRQLLAEGCTRIFDLGGHIGVSYYAYQRYLNYPGSLRWAVHDVPAVVEHGRSLAAEWDRQGSLAFCDHFEDVNGMDIMMALGSLQYLPETLADRLKKIPALPCNLILNLTPLHEQVSYFTLQSIGTAFCPYRITAIPEFTRSLEGLGYKLVDHWENTDKHCDIPFFPGYSLDRYHGFFYRLEG